MNDISILKDVQLFLFDMDGTLYLGNRLFSFTRELLSAIKATGRRYMFMTNNSSKSVADYIKKLEKLGITAEREDFITSSQATAYYLKKYHKANATTFNSPVKNSNDGESTPHPQQTHKETVKNKNGGLKKPNTNAQITRS